MSELPIRNPEASESETKVAEQQLGSTCANIILLADTLSMAGPREDGLQVVRRAKRGESSFVNGMTTAVLHISNLKLTDGTEYVVDINHSDDANRQDDPGVFDVNDPYANYRMTFRQVADTPEGQVELQAFSVEMGRLIHGKPGNITGNPSSLIVWDLDDPGSADYLRGPGLLNSPQYRAMQESEELLLGEQEKLFAKLLYQ